MDYPGRSKSDKQQQWLQSFFFRDLPKWHDHTTGKHDLNPSIHSLRFSTFLAKNPTKNAVLVMRFIHLTSVNFQTLDVYEQNLQNH